MPEHPYSGRGYLSVQDRRVLRATMLVVVLLTGILILALFFSVLRG